MFESIGKAIELFQRVSALASKVKSIELQEALVKLREELVTVKNEALDLLEENERLKRESTEAAVGTAAAIRPKVGMYGMYYLPDGDGPFCTTCFDTKGLLVRTVEAPAAAQIICKYRCNACKAHFN